ncbi:DNA replication and repair protein RecF [Litorimonas cladophorae]|uniref:DNA replication and repair protein RecF n=1 Tax=Litorimonas cladophorae TaxID=1220491 RepID=A0A918NJH5_9PROT|nr:DNA replication/repair protein RecF [Litorimonas cladophorae]GGX75208.1 DNA replication and repair protein RecF [Litorimonas cladophorae]
MPSIASLRLIDFRSYAALDAAFEPSVVALYGPNGAGKTNLLEAVSLLAPGRGLRQAGVGSLARVEDGMSQPAWGINAQLHSLEGDIDDPTRISIGQVPEHPRKRQLKIDGRPATGPELARRLSLLWLTPAQDRLFSGAASDRRKFIDRYALAFAPDHGTNASRFEKARTERNRLLSENVSDRLWYEAIEADLSNYGARVAQARMTTVTNLQIEVSARKTAFPQSLIGLDGNLENRFADGADLTTVAEDYRAQLASTRSIDLRAGRTLIGPHRTELHVTHAEKAMPAALCSTGEQKALLIGLILAQARAVHDKEPILLLDEVAAHLDAVRRAALAEELLDLGLQIFMTGTDQSLFSDFGARAQFFHVADGALANLDGMEE